MWSIIAIILFLGAAITGYLYLQRRIRHTEVLRAYASIPGPIVVMSNSPDDREEFERCCQHGQLLEASENTLWDMLKGGQVQFEGRTVRMVLALPYRETAATERWEQYDERSQAECDAYIRFYHRWLRSLGPVNENTIWYEAHVRGKAAAQQAPNFLTDTIFAQ